MGASPAERAVLVGIELTRRATGAASAAGAAAEESLEELAALARSAGAEVVASEIQARPALDAATLIGSGKVDEIGATARGLSADLVIFDRELSGVQVRNLERALERRVIDRTQLILDIFAARARTREGQLQVELAQLNYLLPRLVGHGASMSRLGAGIGTRGPGETKLETDRRRIARRIKKIEQEIEHVRGARGVQRRQRRAVPLATVALVGYTNAGKSTLFNRLTGAGVAADARLFATLDPTVRQCLLPSNRRVLLSDTVGFIRQLPTTLVKAFRATLEEVQEAALLLHVVDAAAPAMAEHAAHVNNVLADIGAEATTQIVVCNKLDLLAAPPATRLPAAARVAVSARTGDGVAELLDTIDRLLPADPVERVRFRFPHSAAARLSLVYDFARVLSVRHEAEFTEIEAEAPESLRRRLAEFFLKG